MLILNKETDEIDHKFYSDLRDYINKMEKIIFYYNYLEYNPKKNQVNNVLNIPREVIEAEDIPLKEKQDFI